MMKIRLKISEKIVTVCKFYVLKLQSSLITETGNVSQGIFSQVSLKITWKTKSSLLNSYFKFL